MNSTWKGQRDVHGGRKTWGLWPVVCRSWVGNGGGKADWINQRQSALVGKPSYLESAFLGGGKPLELIAGFCTVI